MVAPIQRDPSQFFGPGVSAFGRQFGSTGRAVREPGTDRPLTAEDLNERLVGRTGALGGLNELAGEDDLSQIQQLLSPTLSGGQQNRITRFAKLAQGRGFQGRGLNARINALNTGFLAQNRAGGLTRAAELAQGRLGQVQEAVNPFFQVQEGITGNLESFLQSGQGSDLLGINFEGTGGALQALSAVGLGADAFAGIGQATGNFLGRPGNQVVGSAISQFLDPASLAFNPGFAQSIGQQQIGGPQGRLQLFAAARQASGNELRNQIQARLSDFSQGAADVTAQAGGAQTLLGTRQGQQQILGQDLSRFGQLFQNLGLTQGGSNVNPPAQGDIASGLFTPGRLFG